MAPYAETNTFGAVDPFTGIAGAFFDFVAAPKSGSTEENVEKGYQGEYLPSTHKKFGEMDEITAEYVANIVGAITMPTITLGVTDGDLMVTAAKLSSINTGQLKLSITGHQHIGALEGTAHVENGHVVVWPSGINGFGAFDPFGSSGIPAAQIQSSSYDVSIEHIDEKDSVGNFLVGRSQGVKVEASLEAVTDVETVPDPTGWKMKRPSLKRGNDAFYGISLAGTMYPGDTWEAGT